MTLHAVERPMRLGVDRVTTRWPRTVRRVEQVSARGWGHRECRDLAPAYPRCSDFAAARDRIDPDRLLACDYVARVLG